MINSNFLSIDEEKKERILNAAMKEFAQKGFDNASTNEMVKEANISKGLLFHYFGSKKELFMFLFNYSVELFSNEFYGKIDMNERDIFELTKQSKIIKLGLINKYPGIFEFMQSAVTEASAKVKDEMDSMKNELVSAGFNKVFENIDTSKFRDSIDASKVLKVIEWTFEGMLEQELRKARFLNKKVEVEKLYDKADEYIEFFKICFYK
ncbi:MAG: helix-turn-helix domain-containing protein [Bacillota bacterium]|nr:helix-turn-helix domain-containing protein [Bacillota bacterium]